MISQLQSIRSFIDRKLGEVVKWTDCIPDPGGNADHASAVIPIKGKRYRIASTSAYIKPSLGELVMTDLQDQHEIRGVKSDAVWAEIEKYMRRGMSGEPIEASAPAAAVLEPPKPAPAYPDDRVPYLGQGVTFITERGEPIGGMTELAAIVTEIISPTIVALTVLPKTGELFWRNDLPRKHAGRERNCWDFSEPVAKPPQFVVPEGFELPDEIDKRPGAIIWVKPARTAAKKKSAA